MKAKNERGTIQIDSEELKISQESEAAPCNISGSADPAAHHARQSGTDQSSINQRASISGRDAPNSVKSS